MRESMATPLVTPSNWGSRVSGDQVVLLAAEHQHLTAVKFLPEQPAARSRGMRTSSRSPSEAAEERTTTDRCSEDVSS